MNRKRLALFILLIALALSIVWAITSRPRLKTVATLKYAPGKPAPSPTGATPPATRPGDDRTLRLDLLDRKQSEFAGYRKDIFKPLFVDEVKLMQKKAAAAKPVLPPPQPPRPIGPPPGAQPPVPAAPPPEAPQRELGRFTFLGFLKKDNQRIVFLARDRDIMLVRKGESFGGRYMASSITEQALTIQVKDTGEEIVIPLQENRPLQPARR